MKCEDCRWWREEWSECCYGGGRGCYCDAQDECWLGFELDWMNEKNNTI